MKGTSMSTEERLTSLERTNRNLRWGIAACVVIVGVGAWRERQLPAAPANENAPKVLNLEMLNIIGSDGTIVATLANNGKGNAVFKMGATGNGLGITTHPDGSCAVSLDDGENVLTLTPAGISMSERSASAVRDRERILRRIAAGEKGITNDEMSRVYTLPPSTIAIDTHGGLLVKNKFGKDAVRVQANKKNVGAIYLGDTDGQIQHSLIAE